jgi:hypothetical protein
MSGGSWNYLYSKVDDMAGTLARSDDPLRRAFGEHLALVAEAMHDIEWVDSCDYGRGDEHKAILAVVTPAMVDASARARILEAAQAVIQALTP